MDDRHDSEELFSLMRQHFVDDPEENLEALRECTALVSHSPQAAVQKALLVLHNMKGSAQAVGFLAFAAVLHEAEEVLGSMAFASESEHLFCQLIDRLEAYFHRLAETLDDLPGLDADCRQQLTAFAGAQGLKAVTPSPAWGLFEESEAPPPAVLGPAVPQARSLEKELSQEAGKYLLLEQSGRLFAIRLDSVKEIVSDHILNPLPHPKQGLRGLIVVRNRALPVLDLGMSIDGRGDDKRICAVICESSEQSFAFRVQKPRQVIALEAADFESLGDKQVGLAEHQQLIKHVAKFNGQSVLVVDLKAKLVA